MLYFEQCESSDFEHQIILLENEEEEEVIAENYLTF